MEYWIKIPCLSKVAFFLDALSSLGLPSSTFFIFSSLFPLQHFCPLQSLLQINHYSLFAFWSESTTSGDFKQLFVYMRWGGGRERKQERERASTCSHLVHSLDDHNVWDWARAKARSQEHNPDFLLGWQEPYYLSYHICLPDLMWCSFRGDTMVSVGEGVNDWKSCGMLNNNS